MIRRSHFHRTHIFTRQPTQEISRQPSQPSSSPTLQTCCRRVPYYGSITTFSPRLSPTTGNAYLTTTSKHSVVPKCNKCNEYGANTPQADTLARQVSLHDDGIRRGRTEAGRYAEFVIRASIQETRNIPLSIDEHRQRISVIVLSIAQWIT